MMRSAKHCLSVSMDLRNLACRLYRCNSKKTNEFRWRKSKLKILREFGLTRRKGFRRVILNRPGSTLHSSFHHACVQQSFLSVYKHLCRDASYDQVSRESSNRYCRCHFCSFQLLMPSIKCKTNQLRTYSNKNFG